MLTISIILTIVHLTVFAVQTYHYLQGDDGYLNITGIVLNAFAAFLWSINVIVRL